MRKFNCYNCKKDFTVIDNSWTTAVCPHCQKLNTLPNTLQQSSTADVAQGGIAILQFVFGLIAVILGLAVLFS